MKLYEELVARGIIAQTTGEDQISELINNGKATFYIGFDPTAESLHAGSYVALAFMRRLQLAGNKPILLLGGGTGLIGDPSGRTDMRQHAETDIVAQRVESIRAQVERFLDFDPASPNAAIMVNNVDWLAPLNYMEFLRDIGPHFSVNRMLSAECYKQRLATGLSFIEFNYMLLQSYDFLVLYQKYGCMLQCGGDDQWSNLLGGTELIRRKLGKDAHAMTIPLLTTSSGTKMGKTLAGAVWLDANLTSPFDFYQYWRNVADDSVIKCLKMLSFVPLAEIAKYEKMSGAELNEAKKLLAWQLTAQVHGEAAANAAVEAAAALFEGGASSENMPTTALAAADYPSGGVDICDLLIACGLAPSRAEAKRLILGGGVLLNDTKVTKIDDVIALDSLGADGAIIKKGKKTYHRVVKLT